MDKQYAKFYRQFGNLINNKQVLDKKLCHKLKDCNKCISF